MVETEAGQQQQQSQIILQGTSFNLFIEAIRSPQTKIAYKNSIKRYMNHLKITDIDNLLLNNNSSKIIESQIIDYIMSLRKDGVSYSTIRYLIAPIF
jgi:hypothetical protein